MKPKIKTTCTKLQLQLLSFCLLCLSGKTRCDGNGPAVVTVEQGSDAVLPCSLSTKEDIEFHLFDWKKPAQIDGGQKEVFYYDAGITYDSGRAGQSEQFKGRVSHFPEELKHGNASIIIRNTTVTDSGNYTCNFPDLQPRQTFHIELVVEQVVVKVEEGRDALLPCSHRTKENIEQGYFDWNKVAQNNEKQKEVFQYLNGRHSNNGSESQDEEFKGRVSHFQEELKDGNASIIIRNTKMADSGDYTCTLPESRQTFHIKLVVDCVLKDRTDEKKPGTCPKPNLKILGPTKDGMLLQCVVRGASPKPKVEWRDSSGNKLSAEEPQVTDRGGLYDIILQTTVTKMDNYSCVSTQEEICHQMSDDTHVPVNEPVVVAVEEGRDALLPCSLNTNKNIEQGYFDWNKVAQNDEKQEVFQYLKGRHSNTGFGSQDEEFKGRVSHFQEELKHGNASIIIRNTKVADSGDYTCTFTEPRKTFHIKLVVDGALKDRTDENIPGAAPKPNIEHLDQTDNWALLQCEANGNPQPEVEWRDSAGNKLPAEEPQVSERDGRFYVTLNTTVTKTDRYRCVATQKTISHQIYAETFVRLNGPAVVTVEQGRDAVLPCSLSPKENIESYRFDWKKPAQIDGGQKEVFYYDAGITYDNGYPGQSEEFKGRVSHFPEELKHGDASIIIRNTKMADSGDYTCSFPNLQPPQTFHIELVVEPVVVKVEEDGDALLPCSLSTKENIEQGFFDWNKVAQNDEKQKEVFLYDKGRHSPNFGSQDDGFKGRVFHFPQELKHGNASIIIRNTKIADSGDYTCTFTESRQTFHIKLVVGAAPTPSIEHLDQTDNWALLQCKVHGNPQPEVEWRDSAGNKLPAEEPQVTERDGRFFITLNTTVTKTDRYRCVATQKDINHQIYAETFVRLNGGVLKNRLDENILGAAPKPNIRTLDQTDYWALLQCEANGNPQPEVEWRDSAGNKLPAEEPEVSERDGLFYVTLNTTVTKTDRYRCVATQKDISHQIHDETFVRFNDSTGLIVGIVVLAVIVIILAAFVYKCHITRHCKKGSPADENTGSAVPLKSQPSQSQEAPDPET